ncbi:MAG: T9SS type A sorting domain-containing protein, partial [Nitrospirota bacterium]
IRNIIVATLLLSSCLFQDLFSQQYPSGQNWNIVPSPNPRSNNRLNAIVAFSANDVWAAGIYEEIGVTPVQPLTMHWNGTTWTHVTTPLPPPTHNGHINGLAGVSGKDVWAVGVFFPGTAGQTMIMRWQDTSWTIIPSANRVGYNELRGVTAISENNVWAVGYSPSVHATLVEHWDGTSWVIVPSPPISFSFDYILEGVAAVSDNDIWAVGYMDRGSGTRSTLIEHWDGTSWTIVTSPNPGVYVSTLSSVTALSANDVWTVGWYSSDGGATYLTMTIHWNGTTWSVIQSPNPSPIYNELKEVRAVSANNIWAVGLSSPGIFSEDETLIEHWDGIQWSIVPSPNTGSFGSALYSAAVLPNGEAWAVGSSFTLYDPFAPSQTLVEHYIPTAVNIEAETEQASGFKLFQNFPNPFNPTTRIDFSIPKAGLVNLKVFDISGKEVSALINEFKSAGEYTIKFDGLLLAGGVYFYRLSVDGINSETKRMVLIK